MQNRSAKSLQFILAILVFTSSTSILSTDLYAPSLAHLPAYFNTSAEMVKLTMTFNVLAYALSQLIYGPMSDRFGRRPILIGGMIAFTISSLACALAQSIEQLILARIFQGVSGAAEAVLILAIIRDLFSGRDRIKALALFGIALAAAPAVGPLMGGYIHAYFGWRANFYLLTLLAVIALTLIIRFLPESSEPDHHAIKLSQISKSYFQLFTNRLFICYALLVGCALGSIFAFITAGPFIYINHFGIATEQFGVYYFFIVGSFMLGSFFANRVAHSIQPETSLWIGVSIAAIGAVGLMLFTLNDNTSPIIITVAMCLVLFGGGPVFAIAPSMALGITENRIGYASALLGCTELLVAGVAAASITLLHDETAMPLATTVMGLLVSAVALLWMISRQTQTAASHKSY